MAILSLPAKSAVDLGMPAENLLSRIGAAFFGEASISAPRLHRLDARGTELLFIYVHAVHRGLNFRRGIDKPDRPVTQRQQIIHHLIRAVAIVADDVIQIPLFEIVVHHDQWKTAILELCKKRMAIIAASASTPSTYLRLNSSRWPLRLMNRAWPARASPYSQVCRPDRRCR